MDLDEEKIKLMIIERRIDSVKELIANFPPDVDDKARKYWESVEQNIRKASEPLMIDIEFKEGVAPVYKWECGKYCDYSRVCPSPLNKEFVK